MKRTLAALVVGALLGSLLAGLIALSSAVAAGSGAQATTENQPIATATTPAPTPAAVVVPVSVEPPVGVAVEGKAEPYPEGTDPVLGGRRWGTRSSSVRGAKGHAVTNDLHSNVEGFESDLLTKQQSSELLDIFRHSKGVRRLVRSYGGDPDHTEYYVKVIDANEDQAGNSTAWVTATLRADFASPEGRRGIEMQVYRKKIDHYRLDNTPYVQSTQVSYVDSEGELSRDAGYHPPGDSGVSSDGLRTLRFRN